MNIYNPSSDRGIELDGWGDNEDYLAEMKDYDWQDAYDEQKAWIKEIHNAAKKKEQKAKRALKAQERALQAQVQATGQALLIQGPNKPVVIAPTGSVLTSHNTVLSPDGWETVVPRGTVLHKKHR